VSGWPAAGSFETFTKSIAYSSVQRCGLSSVPRLQQGTTVTLAGFCAQLPVRLRALQANSDREAELIRARVLELVLTRTDVALRLLNAATGDVLLDLRQVGSAVLGAGRWRALHAWHGLP
jgi:DNA mismatch repair ATPase MutL